MIPDRIETVTYMAATAVTGGRVRLLRTDPDNIASVIPAFEEAGCGWKEQVKVAVLAAA